MVENLDKNSLKLLRHSLSSIDLKDIEEKEMSESETKDYNASISAVFPRLEKDIKKFLYEQLMFIAINSENWNQVVFGRGTYNGIDLLLNHWRQAHTAHTSRSGEGEGKKFDEHKVIGEVEE